MSSRGPGDQYLPAGKMLLYPGKMLRMCKLGWMECINWSETLNFYQKIYELSQSDYPASPLKVLFDRFEDVPI